MDHQQEEWVHLKFCKKCKTNKPLAEFPIHSIKGKKRRLAMCKSCWNCNSREWAKRNPEKRKKSCEKYLESDKGKAGRAAIALRERKKANRNAWLTRYRRMKKFGLSNEDYERMLDSQNNVCAACGKPERRKHASGRVCSLAIDHDHATGKIRGLLCHSCNISLGWLSEDPLAIRGLLAYLEKWKPGVSDV